MNCILIEKAHPQNNIKDYLGMVPYFNLVSFCSSVFDAYEIINSHKIDIIFVDTELQKVSGIDFIKSLNKKPLFVFISDRNELAVEAFNLNALDFLLKPVSFDRFLRTAHKAYDCFNSPSCTYKPVFTDRENLEKAENKTILVKTDYKTKAIKLDEILYIEGLKDYIKIYTLQDDKPVITLNSLKRLQHHLPSSKFSRIHKSYIVGIDHINSINKSQVIIRGRSIPIGESYRLLFTKKMQKFRI